MPRLIKAIDTTLASISSKNRRKVKSEVNLKQHFTTILRQILGNRLPKEIAIGVSGGSDSMALAIFLQEFAIQNKIDLTAITVDHRLREDSANEARSVGLILKKMNIRHVILESYLEKAPESNIEAEMREVRYNLLTSFCHKNGIENLFIAHHQQDLAENFLIRLFRGSGIDGLASLEYVSDFNGIKIVRPLLDFDKKTLEKYLLHKKIPWFFDQSNDDEKHLRNKIRRFLKSLDNQDLINQRIALASKSILTSRKLIEDEMILQSKEIISFSNLGYFLLRLDEFRILHPEKALRYLAWMLMDTSGSFYKPRLDNLQQLYDWILHNSEHKPRTLYGCVVEKYDNQQLIIYREKQKIKYQQSKNFKYGHDLWDNRFLINSNSDLNDYKIINIEAREFNLLVKKIKNFAGIKNPLKKVFYTIPVFKKNDQIVAIPQLDYYSVDSLKSVEIKFQAKSKLTQ